MKEKKFYPKWRAQAKGTNLYFERDNEFRNHLIPLNNKELEVVVKPRVKHRSRQEEKFYHAVVVDMVAEEMNINKNLAHEQLSDLFLRREESTTSTNGKKTIRYHRTLSTTELSDTAYREYWEQCIKWAALPTKPSGLAQDSGLELFIPYPNEVDYMNW